MTLPLVHLKWTYFNMDPPYQGISFTRDHRYCNGLSYDEFVEALSWMNERRLSFLVSYDGRTGEKQHGNPLPDSLNLGPPAHPLWEVVPGNSFRRQSRDRGVVVSVPGTVAASA